MRAYVRQQTHLPKRLTRFDIAYVHFYYRHLALFHRIPQRYTRMTISSGIQDNPVTFEGLYLINQVAFVV